jgi:hypothetical protein
MPEIPKRVKRLLREHATMAHEEELRQALTPLSEAFGRWEKGQLSSLELTELIHEYHQGPARELFNRYGGSWLELPVAYAIHHGILQREKVPQELLDYLSRHLQFYEEDEKPR